MNQNTKTHAAPSRGAVAFRRPAAVLALLAASALLTACGSSSTSSNGSAGGSNHASKQENSRLQFSKCMREHGVEIPESSAGGAPSAGLVNTPQSTLTAAANACRQYATGAVGAAATRNSAQLTDTIVRFAACMRQNGVSIPDPTWVGGQRPAGVRTAGRAGAPEPGLRCREQQVQEPAPERRRRRRHGNRPGSRRGRLTAMSPVETEQDSERRRREAARDVAGVGDERERTPVWRPSRLVPAAAMLPLS